MQLKRCLPECIERIAMEKCNCFWHVPAIRQGDEFALVLKVHIPIAYEGVESIRLFLIMWHFAITGDALPGKIEISRELL